MIGKLLGHTQVRTTTRYAHLARDSIQTAAARITGSIGGNLSPAQGVDETAKRRAHTIGGTASLPAPVTGKALREIGTCHPHVWGRQESWNLL